MRFLATFFALTFLLLFTGSIYAQGANDADKIIMRLRPVCNFGQGGQVVVSFEIKARAGSGSRVIGAYTIVLTYTSSKLVFNGATRRYEYSYWGGFYRDNAIGASTWYNQHATTSTGNALPLTNQYFTPSADCSGAPLNDGYFEIIRYTFTVNPSASGTVNFGMYNILPYKAGIQFQDGLEASGIYYADRLNNGNDSSLIITGMVVPVELTGFTALPRPDGTVSLSWRTESETSNLGFEIERGDGDTFERIGFVEGKGTVTTPSEYTFIDKDAASASNRGIVLYRLKQIDIDGTEAYSYIVSTKMIPATMSLEQHYPNPVAVGSSTNIPFKLAVPASVDLYIYNSLGQKITTLANHATHESGYHEIVWDGHMDNGKLASSGVYFVRFNATPGSGEMYTQTRQISVIR